MTNREHCCPCRSLICRRLSSRTLASRSVHPTHLQTTAATCRHFHTFELRLSVTALLGRPVTRDTAARSAQPTERCSASARAQQSVIDYYDAEDFIAPPTHAASSSRTPHTGQCGGHLANYCDIERTNNTRKPHTIVFLSGFCAF